MPFELAEEAFVQAGASVWLAAGLVLGALTFFGGNVLVSRMGGKHRKRATGPDEGGSGLAIVLDWPQLLVLVWRFGLVC